MDHPAQSLFEDDAAAAPNDDSLARVAVLAERQRDLERDVADLEARLKERNALLRKVSEEDLPDLLDEVGLSEVRLADGTKIVVGETIRVSTTGKYRGVINDWLVEQGHDDLIKDDVLVRFGRDEGEAVARLVEFLDEALPGAPVKRTRAVNASTFAALLRELKEAGEPVPYDELGAFVHRRAKLVG